MHSVDFGILLHRAAIIRDPLRRKKVELGCPRVLAPNCHMPAASLWRSGLLADALGQFIGAHETQWDATSVHEFERVTPPKLRCLYSVDSRSVPQAARHISVSISLLDETQPGEAVGRTHRSSATRSRLSTRVREHELSSHINPVPRPASNHHLAIHLKLSCKRAGKRRTLGSLVRGSGSPRPRTHLLIFRYQILSRRGPWTRPTSPGPLTASTRRRAGLPCMRHRPFGIAAPRHLSPSRRLAPHRGEAFASVKFSRSRCRGRSAGSN